MRCVLRTMLIPWILALPIALSAQQHGEKIPKRPSLDADADTNDPAAYYNYGTQKLEARPDLAADAFYWAMRIRPDLPETWYARRIALLMEDDHRLVGYVNEDRNTLRSKEVQRIDSLQLRALALDPLLYRKLDTRLLTAYMMALGRENDIADADMDEYLHQVRGHLSPFMNGWMAYCDGRFTTALSDYAEAIKHDKEAYGLHADRAQIFYLLGNMDSALTEMNAAVTQMKQADAKQIVYLYDSKAVYDVSIGIIDERRRNLDAAREAYGQALTEDLSYYPAHMRLSVVALEAGDTATALNEINLAVQLREDDPVLRFRYGYMLVLAHRGDDAVTQLRKAIELEPYYAAPYQILGRVYEAAHMIPEAIEQYQGFVNHAARNDPQYAWTQQRLTALRSSQVGAQGSKP